MSGPAPVSGRAPPVLVLCRQCLQYVFEGTSIARETGQRYRNEGYLAIETIQRIDRLRSAANAQQADD